jgi:hypothetical protein
VRIERNVETKRGNGLRKVGAAGAVGRPMEYQDFVRDIKSKVVFIIENEREWVCVEDVAIKP